MLKKIRKAAYLIILGMVTLMSLFGCIGAKKYRVDYSPYDAQWFEAKDSYRAGQTVKLSVPLATDTNYSLSVDGVGITPEVTGRGSTLVYIFTMPDHDVKVDFGMVNSMINVNADPDVSVDYTQALLADYYTAPVAIVGESIYHEITLNRGSDGNLYLNVYEGSRDEGTTTSHTVYRVVNPDYDGKPDAVVGELNEVVRQYRMEDWNGQPGVGLDGRITVCKFRNSNSSFMDFDHEIIRVSTEHMPDNGEKAIAAFRDVLEQALQNAEPVETDE